jgi:hypothetical protein
MVEASENWDDWEEEDQVMDVSSTPTITKMSSTSSESVKVLDPHKDLKPALLEKVQ